MKVAPARTRATRWGAFTQRQRSCAASMSLKAMARPAAREPGPLVTLVRCLTMAKADSIGLAVRKCARVLMGLGGPMGEFGLRRGRADLRSAGPITFGPAGILFLADNRRRRCSRSMSR